MKPLDQNKTEVSIEAFLNTHGYYVYTAQGNSMLPFIRPYRDIVEIHKKNGRISKYEVALYRRNDKYVLHRCLHAYPQGRYVFAGDHNTHKEYGVTDEMILGTMVCVIREGKTIRPDNIYYKIYYHLLVDLYPLRAAMLKSVRMAYRIFRPGKRCIAKWISRL